MKENLYIDIETQQVTHELSSRIAEKTGLEEPEIYTLLREIEEIRNRKEAITEERMKELIRRMNRIIEKTL
ncbi:MAG: hypothetical protein LUE93_07260 [Bacteroides sp.]|nr:hypothetical protein [Bacteroides sp.]